MQTWLREDPDVQFAVVSFDSQLVYSVFYFESQRMAQTAVAKNGLLLRLCAPEFRDNEEIALLAIRNHCSAFRYISDRLKRDRAFVIKAVKIDGDVVDFADEFAQDEEIVRHAQAQITAARKLETDRNTINIVVQP